MLLVSVPRDAFNLTGRTRPPARLVLGWCRLGALHVAVRDNIEADETIIETAYQPDPAMWEPDFKTRRTL